MHPVAALAPDPTLEAPTFEFVGDLDDLTVDGGAGLPVMSSSCTVCSCGSVCGSCNNCSCECIGTTCVKTCVTTCITTCITTCVTTCITTCVTTCATKRT
jgi:hypothetical protein